MSGMKGFTCSRANMSKETWDEFNAVLTEGEASVHKKSLEWGREGAGKHDV